ncbi:MAG: rRNA maturation RNase YbeY [bacterium]|nr:rRNA maturation RNase YbeY [bacterium]
MSDDAAAGPLSRSGPRPAADGSGAAESPAAPRRRISHGPVTVDVADERAAASEARPPMVLELDRWGRLAAAAAHDEGVRRPAEMGLRFVDEAVISELAGRWLDSPRPTDVLAFPVEAPSRRPGRRIGGGPPLLVGDVVVCPSVAARGARAAGRPPEDELALLVVHGVLHLLGHDHAGRIESRRMRRRTRALLARHDRV